MWVKNLSYFLIFFLLLYNVNALGMATDYISDNTILLGKGESKLHRINLQNPDDKALKVRFGLGGTEIAEIIGEENVFVLPPKSFDKEIYLNITVPENAKIGDEFMVSYSLTALLDQETGVIGFNPTINGKIKVRVVPRESESFIGNVIAMLEKIERPELKGKKDFISIETKSPKERKDNFGIIIFLIAAIILVTALIFNKSRSIISSMKLVDEEFLKKVPKDIQIHPDKYFYLHSGEVIKGLHELPHMLKNIEGHIFNHHVNEEKNDFANWLRDVFGKKELADEIENLKERHEIIDSVKKHIK